MRMQQNKENGTQIDAAEWRWFNLRREEKVIGNNQALNLCRNKGYISELVTTSRVLLTLGVISPAVIFMPTAWIQGNFTFCSGNTKANNIESASTY